LGGEIVGTEHSFVVGRPLAAGIALGSLLVLAIIAQLVVIKAQPRADGVVSFRRRGLKALVIGADGRASTSKLQAVLWTFAVVFALVFLLVWGRSTRCGDSGVRDGPRCQAAATARAAFSRTVNHPPQADYYVLLGFPLTAALAAKALTSSKVASGTLTKPPAGANGPTPEGGGGKSVGVVKGLSEVVANDQGETDLLDFQYFAFNLVTLAFFFVEFLTHPANGLPNLPPTLIALSGLSAAAYTTKKALETDIPPVITSVVPHRVPLVAGTQITALGNTFGPPPDSAASAIMLEGVPLDVVSWDDRKIVATIAAASLTALPQGAQTTGAAQLTISDANGSKSDPYTVELYQAGRTTRQRS